MDSRRALALAEGSRKELLALLEALIAEPSPCGGSAAGAQELLGDYLAEGGFEVALREDAPDRLADHPEFSPPPPSPERPRNLVARPPGSEAAGIILFAHVDTEPAGEGWSRPPHEPVRQGRRLHGLGAADDKGGLAAAAVAAVLARRHLPRAPVLLSVHGKGGGARGTLPVFERMATAAPSGGEARVGCAIPGALRVPERRGVADAPAVAGKAPRATSDRSDSPGTPGFPPVPGCLYVHPPENGAGLAILKNGSRGVFDLELRVRGWRGAPREIRTPESARFEDGGDALAAALEVVETVRRALPDCGVHLGRFRAGEASGVTPLHAAASLRVLTRGGRTAGEVLGACRRAARDTLGGRGGRHGSFRFRVRTGGLLANPARTPWNDPFCRALGRSVAEVTGREPREYTLHLASDIRFPIRLLGAPAVGIGSRAGNFYGPDEWVDLDDLVRLVAVLTGFMARRQRSGAEEGVS